MGRVNEAPVAEIPACMECGARWLPADETPWQLAVDIDEFACYCPACAEGEFGEP